MGFAWYWHRLRAMSPAEVALRLRKRVREFEDSQKLPVWPNLDLTPAAAFPKLPDKSKAPAMFLDTLRADAAKILKGHWCAFGALPIQVDDPPKWHKDYLAGQHFQTDEAAFRLNYRHLPNGGDIKLIWELSRWYELVRLAQAAYLLNDTTAADKCLACLENWIQANPLFRGWNWTSALESGLRLIQFAWIDALLGGSELRQQILPAHVWYTWRHRSFGSSANNHLLGELAGLIIATVRWPALTKLCAPLARLQSEWERQILAQFAEDGGNREQALNYHLFAWEFCWQTWQALEAAGKSVSQQVKDRLHRAAEFFVCMQIPNAPWDYGDSDSAFVTPFSSNSATQQWWSWLAKPGSSAEIEFWCGPFKDLPQKKKTNDWLYFPETGMARLSSGPWDLRWDLSPLGFLSTAAHGHLDALHLSIWWKGMPVIIDPGTGSYFSDPELRSRLAAWEAHNGPRIRETALSKRLGPFLWSQHHARPTWENGKGQLRLPKGVLQRRVKAIEMKGWEIEDSFSGRTSELAVRWQFSPGAMLSQTGKESWRLQLAGANFDIKIDGNPGQIPAIIGEAPVSPAFRQVAKAPYLELATQAGDSCVLRTVIIISQPP